MLGCAPKEEKIKVKCNYCGMEMYQTAMEASMEYEGKTLYFCTKEEMEKFKEDPEAYLSGKKKGKIEM
jgi:YHS domain-containing protein